MFGAYLVFPLVAKFFLALSFNFTISGVSLYLMFIFNMVCSFALSFALYLFIECPLTDLFKMIVTDIVKVAQKRV